MADSSTVQQADAAVDRWNASYPPGTPVWYGHAEPILTATTDYAAVVAGAASVRLHGIGGVVQLELVTAAQDPIVTCPAGHLRPERPCVWCSTISRVKDLTDA